MAAIITNDEHYYHIASAIRERLAVDTKYRPSDMAPAIMTISSTGTDRTVIPYAVRMNGIYEAPSSVAYDPVTVSVDSHVDLLNVSFVSNGVYVASEKTAFKNVVVDIPGETIIVIPFTATSNQQYYAPANYVYNPVTVDVPLYSLSAHTFYSDGTFVAPSGYLYGPIVIDAKGNADNTSIYSLVKKSIYTFSESSITTIRSYLFYDNATVTFSTPQVIEIGRYAFYSCYVSISTISLSLCKTIGNNAFQNAGSAIKAVSLPVCESIGDYAFSSCSSISAVYAPECKYIGARAFHNCKSLSSIIASNCEIIGDYAFSGCSALHSISFPECVSIGIGAFEGLSLSFPASSRVALFPKCETVGSFAFNGIGGYYFEAIDLPVCTYIGSFAFADFSYLTSISAPECTYLGDGAIPISSRYGTANFPKVTIIRQEQFSNYTHLTDLRFDAVSRIEFGAFRYCHNIHSAYFSNCSYIGSYAFQEGMQTSNWYIDLRYTSFPRCSYVGSGAFMSCYRLQSISLPRCSLIEDMAFAYCSILSNVYLTGESVVKLTGRAFYQTPSSAGLTLKIHVPSSLYSLYLQSAYWRTYYSSNLVSM